ncbi:hypothetical protein F441_18567 [Phytophthora nicotianae CJ01A1]|uniref:Uncharacterized protein n=1 Tax=Phytophthora nicotianae CJ01A1 TaxID=1317063 RepID=W2W2W5_PHYNI|nr:hypothetical protein F441_18567 [Phytophthora nicotianae CJ01A1]
MKHSDAHDKNQLRDHNTSDDAGRKLQCKLDGPSSVLRDGGGPQALGALQLRAIGWEDDQLRVHTHTMPCSARGALSSDAGTPRDVKACLHVLARRPRGQLEQPRYGELRERVCQLAQREWQNCYVHLVEGCGNCSEARDRPTRTEWEHQLDLWPLSEVERQAVGRYDRSWSQLEQAGLRNTLHHRGSRRH